MSRTGLQDISTLKDPLQTWNFGFIIPNVPGNGNGLALTLRCKSVVIPGMQLEVAELQLRGMQLNFAGRHVYSHTLPVTITEHRDMLSRQSILRWQYKARDFRNNTGSYKTTYATTADIELYDDTGAVIRTIRLYGLFPTQLDDLTTESAATAVAEMSVSFSYDFFRDLEDI